MKRKPSKQQRAKPKPALAPKPLTAPTTIPTVGRTFVVDRDAGGFRPAKPSDFVGERHFISPRFQKRFVTIETRGEDGRVRDTIDFLPVVGVNGVPLPPDLELAVRHYADNAFRDAHEELVTKPCYDSAIIDDEDGSYYVKVKRPKLADSYPDWRPVEASPEQWKAIRTAMEDAFRQGFYLALYHYAEELKDVPEVAALRKVMEAKHKLDHKRTVPATEARKAKYAAEAKDIKRRFRELRKQRFTKKDARQVIVDDTEYRPSQVDRATRGMA